MGKTLKIYVAFFFPSLCMIILPEWISSGVSAVNNIITFIGFILLIFSSIVTGLVLYKDLTSARVLQKAEARDPIWDDGQMKIETRRAFYQVQYALMKKDPDSLKDSLTSEFLSSLKKDLLDGKIQYGPTDIASIDISETHIICCQDFLDNNKDKFVSYIKGTLSDSSANKNIDQNSGNEELPDWDFEEMYHFVRKDNSWLLDGITGKTKIFNLLLTNNRFEK
jgi:predicted lipid-binding transport protein (Tim44 family)